MNTLFVLVAITIMHPIETIYVAEDALKFNTLSECEAAGSYLKSSVERKFVEDLDYKNYRAEVQTACISYLSTEGKSNAK